MEKKYQVFVSSTYSDLMDERKKILQTLMDMDCIPSAMEMFPAADEEQWEYIKKVIDDCDYYLLVIGGKYGSVTNEGISYTEKEYNYAVQKGMSIIAFIHANPDNISFANSEVNPESLEKLLAFREHVKTGRLVKFWTSANELPGLVALSLTKTIKTTPAIGWVRANSIASENATRKILELQDEIVTLKEQLESNKHTMPEGSELLAQSDDKFEIKLRISFTHDTLSFHAPEKRFAKEYLILSTWNELFGALGISASQPIRETKIKSEMARFFKEKFSTQLLKPYGETYSISSATISETTFQTIKLQFNALGFITTTQKMKIQRDCEKEIVFCELTPLGKHKLIEVRAIYRNPKPDNSDKQNILQQVLA